MMGVGPNSVVMQQSRYNISLSQDFPIVLNDYRSIAVELEYGSCRLNGFYCFELGVNICLSAVAW